MKEVIFHFFPSVRFLGLSLKILFHKNKEIKRMLSKKMAFSLMSLITLLALAFVAPSAIAADDFDAGFSVMRVSAVSDHNAAYGTDIDVTLTFGAQVDGTKATLTIFVEDKFGAQTSVTAPTITAKDLNTLTDCCRKR